MQMFEPMQGKLGLLALLSWGGKSRSSSEGKVWTVSCRCSFVAADAREALQVDRLRITACSNLINPMAVGVVRATCRIDANSRQP